MLIVKYEKALSLIKLVGTLLYELNQYYMDSELEDNLMILSNILLKTPTKFLTNQNTILFYDGFGLNNRGLVHIYLKGLTKIAKVIYVAPEKQRNNIPDVLNY